MRRDLPGQNCSLFANDGTAALKLENCVGFSTPHVIAAPVAKRRRAIVFPADVVQTRPLCWRTSKCEPDPEIATNISAALYYGKPRKTQCQVEPRWPA